MNGDGTSGEADEMGTSTEDGGTTFLDLDFTDMDDPPAEEVTR